MIQCRIETLKTLRDGALLNIETAYLREYQMAIDDAIDALEKQIPRAVFYEGDGYADGEMVYDVAYCPACDACFEDGYNWEVNFCPNCGQRLDWGG